MASLAPAEAVILWGADPREDTAASCGRRPAQNATRLSVGIWPAGQRMAEVEHSMQRRYHERRQRRLPRTSRKGLMAIPTTRETLHRLVDALPNEALERAAKRK